MYSDLVVIVCLLGILAPISVVRTVYRLSVWDSGDSQHDDVQPYAAAFSILMAALAATALGFAIHAASNL